ncbi:MAG: hypothetical protein HY071_01550 [Chloroflexi bacterium]|nr:hypothetical protein [Chloroflexota bacterium]
MIRVAVAGSSDLELWSELIRLGELSPDWTLIDARMVELHAAEQGQALLRVSADADAPADARSRPNAVSGLARILVDQGFQLQEPSYFGVGHKFVRGLVEVDVLAPDGLGPTSEAARTTIPPAHTVEVPGGSQALRRSERVEIELGAIRGPVPRPNLLGAIPVKARAVDVDDVPENQRSDLALLLSFATDPEVLSSELEGNERSWIARRIEMDDPDATCWVGLTSVQRQVGLSALRILAGWGEP